MRVGQVIALVLLASAVTTAVAGGGRMDDWRTIEDSLRQMHPRYRARWLRDHGHTDRLPSPGVTLDSGPLQLVGRWSFGPSYDVDGCATPTDTLVALARGSGVSLLRSSRTDTVELEVLADVNAGGLMKRVVVRDSLLYVGSTAGLEIWSIADARSPRQLSWLHTALNDFDVRDSFAYVIGPDDSFKVYNVAEAVNPAFRGACRDSGYSLSVCNGHAYLADRWGLYVVDVTNPDSPYRIGIWGTDIVSVKARSTICCVTAGNGQSSELRFTILDVRNPAAPSVLSSIDSCGGYDIYLDDSLVFLSGYSSSGHEFRILSIRDSTSPRTLGSCKTDGYNFGTWANPARRRAYVADDLRGLAVVNLVSMNAPTVDTAMLAAGFSYDVDLGVNTAYVAGDGYGLAVLDVSDPAHPNQIGGLDSTRDMVTYSVVACDSFVFMGWGPSRPWLRSVSVHDPTRPVKAGGCSTFDWPQDMVLRDSLLYIAEAYRFQVVNVARPRQPALVGSCVTQDGVSFGLAVQDSHAYIISGQLQIVNIARPGVPFVVGTARGGASGIAVKDTFAYIPYAYDTLWVYSIADPSHPRLMFSTPTSVWPRDVALGESTLYIGTSDGWGVDVYDLTDPGRPVRVGRSSAPYDIRRLHYVDGHLYAAMWNAGVAVYETTATGQKEPSVRRAPEPSFTVRPTVTRGELTIRTADNACLTGGVRVCDATGRTILAARPDRMGSTISVDLARCPSGVYWLEGKAGDRRFAAKVIKQ